MVRKLFAVMLLSIFYSVTANLSVDAKEQSWPSYHWPGSSADSKKYGEFKFAVKTTPETFIWEGHQVHVHESWRAQSGTVPYLFFKLKIDSASTEEYRIKSKDKIWPAFRHASDGFPNAQFGIDSYEFTPWRRVLKASLRLPCTEVVHFVRLGNVDTERVVLRVGTCSKAQPYEPTLTDATLSFDVSNENLKLVRDSEKPDLSRQSAVVPEAKTTAVKPFIADFKKISGDSQIGDLICDALYEEGKKYGAQIALHSRARIRSSTDKGPITIQNLNESLPFEDKLVVATITGDGLLKFIENGLAGPLDEHFLEVHGIKLAYDVNKNAGNRIVYALAQQSNGAWEKISPSAHYRIAVDASIFQSIEEVGFRHALDLQYSDKRLSVIFEEYLRQKDLSLVRPFDRIVRVRDGLLKVNIKHGKIVATIQNNYEAIELFAGDAEGVESYMDRAVPLSNAEMLIGIGKMKTESCIWEMPRNEFENKWKKESTKPGIERGTAPFVWFSVNLKPSSLADADAISYPVRLDLK